MPFPCPFARPRAYFAERTSNPENSDKKMPPSQTAHCKYRPRVRSRVRPRISRSTGRKQKNMRNRRTQNKKIPLTYGPVQVPLPCPAARPPAHFAKQKKNVGTREKKTFPDGPLQVPLPCLVARPRAHFAGDGSETEKIGTRLIKKSP